MLMEGKIATAFLWNPLVVLACGAGFLYTLYAVGVLFWEMPAFRVRFSPQQHFVFRTIFLVTTAVNWMYLILVYTRWKLD